MIALRMVQAKLTAFQTRRLFCLAVKLLDFPTPPALFLSRLAVRLSHLVGDEIFRAISRNRHSEQFQARRSGKAFEFDHLSGLLLKGSPRESFDCPIRLGPKSFINLPITLNRTVEEFFSFDEPTHQSCGGIPRIHQHGAKLDAAPLDSIEHLGDVVNFRLAIAVGIEQSVVNNPKAVCRSVVINAGDNADAFDHAARVA